jgi:SOS-response transcriptional repressor LexA
MGLRKNWKLRGVVYIFVRQYISEHGYAPTGAEIASACYCAHSKVAGYLRDLESRGMIVLTKGFRGIELPEQET